MARTRGATGIQYPDGVLLDKEGNVVHATGPRKLTQADVVETPPQPAPQASPPIVRYICDETTLRRDLDAWELARLLSLMTGGALEIDLQPDEFARVGADLRRHFRPVRGE